MSLSVYNPDESNRITVTEKAIAFFKNKLITQDYQAIRISVKKSGCTGYAYVIDYGTEKVEGDKEYQFDDLTVFVTTQAMEMIAGSEIDLVQQGLNKSITFNNPNVTASCGCGSSFSIDETSG